MNPLQDILERTNARLESLSRHTDLALLLLRVGLGLCFIFIHGASKLQGGEATWAELGAVMNTLTGLDIPPAKFWGAMATWTELLGGLFCMLGLLFRPACFMLLGTLIVATISHFINGEGFYEASHAIEIGLTFAALIFVGPGRYSLDTARSKNMG